jgi:hypothetical protein
MRREAVAYSGEMDSHSCLDESGTILRQVFDNDIAASVPQEPIQRRLLLVLRDVITYLDNATVTTAEQLNLIAAGILQQEPSSWLCDSCLMSLLNSGIVQAI